MDLQTTDIVVGISGTAIAAVIALVGFWVKFVLPRQRMNDATNTAILGRPEVRDRSGSLIQPAQPGMVAQVAVLTETLRELVDGRFRTLEHRVDGQDERLTALEEEAAHHGA